MDAGTGPLVKTAPTRHEPGMIAKLTGRLDESGTDWAVIDVHGVGYLVHCSSKTLAALGIAGDEVTVFTDLQVSENDMRLLGFAQSAERDWFRLLTQVQGVGSKVALAILSALTPVSTSGSSCRAGPTRRMASSSEPTRLTMISWMVASTSAEDSEECSW